MTSVPGLDFGSAWSRKILADLGGESAPALCRQDVLQEIEREEVAAPPPTARVNSKIEHPESQ